MSEVELDYGLVWPKIDLRRHTLKLEEGYAVAPAAAAAEGVRRKE